MCSQRVRLVAATALCCGIVLQSPGFARTLSDIVSPPTRPEQALSLASLLQQDALGGDCIAEEDIDEAFLASGKGLRLPRTCLPEPCEEALTPFRLAELIGRPAQQSEWDRYFARYADVCRKEVTRFDDEAPADTGPMSTAAFWAPILGPRITQRRSIAALPSPPLVPVVSGPALPSSSPFDPAPSRGGSNPSPDTPEDEGDKPKITVFDDPDDDPDNPDGNRMAPPDGGGKTPDGSQPPGVVPLPAAFWMLLVGFAGLIGLRRWRR